jgi:DNA-directed RNA polymerase subunit RPC12/RpoP
MIRFTCPTCNQVLQVTPDKAGTKGVCPKCSQKIIVPTPTVQHDEAILGKIEVAPEKPPLASITVNNVNTQNYENDRPRVRCSHCGSRHRPMTIQVISQTGWIVFALLLFFCFPICFIGLLLKETRLACPDCGIRIG